MAFSSLRARLPTSASAAFSTLASFPAAASAGWSQTIRGPNAGGAGLGLLGELRSDDNNDEDDSLRRADEALQRLCWQAGRDSEYVWFSTKDCLYQAMNASADAIFSHPLLSPAPCAPTSLPVYQRPTHNLHRCEPPTRPTTRISQ